MLFKHIRRFFEFCIPALKPKTALVAQIGDITAYSGGAIVNAANSHLAPGGGVCGAIFRASNFDALEDACRELGPCPTGQAVITPSFGMKASYIVHAVGPIWEGGQRNEEALLKGAYINSLKQAHSVGATSIAFPAISTGIYGYPLSEATKIAVSAVQEYTHDHPRHFERVDFMCFDAPTLALYQEILDPHTLAFKAYGSAPMM